MNLYKRAELVQRYGDSLRANGQDAPTVKASLETARKADARELRRLVKAAARGKLR